MHICNVLLESLEILVILKVLYLEDWDVVQTQKAVEFIDAEFHELLQYFVNWPSCGRIWKRLAKS